MAEDRSRRAVSLYQGKNGRWYYALVDTGGQLRAGQLDQRFVPDRSDTEVAEAAVFPYFKAVTGRLLHPWESSLTLVVVAEDPEDDDVFLIHAVVEQACLSAEDEWDAAEHCLLTWRDVTDCLGLQGCARRGDLDPLVAEAIVERTGLQLDGADQAWAVGLLLAYKPDIAAASSRCRIASTVPESCGEPGGLPGSRAADPDLLPDKDLLSVKGLARYLGISTSTAYRLQRRIPSLHAPGVGLRFLRSDVDAYLQQHRRESSRTTTLVSSVAFDLGMPVASAGDEDDDEEVVPGMTRGDLKKIAGY